MLSFNPRESEKERALAERALELFLTTPNLRWQDAYTAAAFERGAPVARFQAAIKRVGQGMPFEQAMRSIDGPAPISSDVSERAWQRRGE